jgi:hypothetical protein
MDASNTDDSRVPIVVQGKLLLWPCGSVKISPANLPVNSVGKSGRTGQEGGLVGVSQSKKRRGGDLKDLEKSFKRLCKEHDIVKACLVGETMNSGR